MCMSMQAYVATHYMDSSNTLASYKAIATSVHIADYCYTCVHLLNNELRANKCEIVH